MAPLVPAAGRLHRQQMKKPKPKRRTKSKTDRDPGPYSPIEQAVARTVLAKYFGEYFGSNAKEQANATREVLVELATFNRDEATKRVFERIYERMTPDEQLIAHAYRFARDIGRPINRGHVA